MMLSRLRLNFGALLKNFLRPLHTLLHYTMVQKDMVQTAQVLWGQKSNLIIIFYLKRGCP